MAHPARPARRFLEISNAAGVNVKIWRIKVTNLDDLEGEPSPGSGEAFSRQKADLKGTKAKRKWRVKETDLGETEGEPTAWADKGIERQDADIKVQLPWVKVGVSSSGPANSPVNISIASTISVLPAAGMGLLLDHLSTPNWVSSIVACGIWLASAVGIVMMWHRNRARHGE
jgi:hypothetical protein